jgi:2-keto-3-deoxy-L-rhamnonate aldolase RhmA
MRLAESPFSTALKAEHKRIGLWTSLSSNLAAEVVTSAGYDWALINPVAHRLVAKGVPVGTLVMHTAFAAEL